MCSMSKFIVRIPMNRPYSFSVGGGHCASDAGFAVVRTAPTAEACATLESRLFPLLFPSCHVKRHPVQLGWVDDHFEIPRTLPPRHSVGGRRRNAEICARELARAHVLSLRGALVHAPAAAPEDC